LYSVAEASKNETGGGDGIGVLKKEPCDDLPLLGGKYHKGQYTYKIYHLASKVSDFLMGIIPKRPLGVLEKVWDAYPYCKTVLSNPVYMKESFFIVIDSIHLADTGVQQNVNELPPEKLKDRVVVHIDIANDSVTTADYKPDEDPTRKQSVGLLQFSGWIR
jgi:hypothetical protein